MVFLDRIFLDDIFVFVRLEVPLGPVLSFYSRWCQTQKTKKRKSDPQLVFVQKKPAVKTEPGLFCCTVAQATPTPGFPPIARPIGSLNAMLAGAGYARGVGAAVR